MAIPYCDADKCAQNVVNLILRPDLPHLGRLLYALTKSPVVFGGNHSRVKCGKNVRLSNTLLNVSSGSISIGDDTFFGHNVCLLTGNHPIDGLGNRQKVFDSGHDIVIGTNVWIASNVTVIGPCKIGDNAVIAAGSVVTSGELDGDYLYAGVPARKIRRVKGASE